MDRKVKPNSSKTGTTILVPFLIFLVCSVASIFLATYHRSTIDTVISLWQSFGPARLVRQAPPPERVAAPQKTGRPLPLGRLLDNSAVVFANGDFSLAEKFAKSDFCDLVQPVFPGHPPKWEPSPFDSGASYCIGQLPTTPAQSGASDNSLFLQIRRNAYGATTMARLKIVYRQEPMQKTFTSEFEDCAAIILRQLFLDDQPDIMQNIKSLRSFDMVRLGIRIRLFEEQLVPGAYNLMIEARCGKYDCPTVSPFYKLGLLRKDPLQDLPAEDAQPASP